MKKISRATVKSAVIAALLSISLPSAGESLSGFIDASTFLEFEEAINVIGLGTGQVPDYQGSDDYVWGVAPFGRYYFSDRRYVQLLGPELTFNVLNHNDWQLGPMVRYRFGRDDDVDDSVVKQMEEIDATIELGLFGAYVLRMGEDPRQRLVFGADFLVDAGDSHSGFISTARINYWHPVARPVVLNFGVGLAYADDDYTDTFFGVDGSDIELFPSLNNQPYEADGGILDYRIRAGGVIHFSENWHMGVGAQYRRLTGDASDSPVVSERGDEDQWLFGIGIGYAWR